jgi:NAD(P)-dependent dehydrogenase (short-subunit alcohol dehydrogenase family)
MTLTVQTRDDSGPDIAKCFDISKHGVAGSTKILTNESTAKGIAVNANALGSIATANPQALPGTVALFFVG